MANHYLDLVEFSINQGIQDLTHTHLVLSDFLSDFHGIEGFENKFPNPIIFNTMNSIVETIEKLKKVNEYIKEENK